MNKIFSLFVVFLSCFSTFSQNESMHYDVNHSINRYPTYEDKSIFSEALQKVRNSQFPTTPISAIAEFQPMSGVLIRYPLGIPVSLVRELSKITQVKVIFSKKIDSIQANQYFTSSQVNMSNVAFWKIPNDSYWVRDYGPWFVIDGLDSVRVIDFVYNRPTRPNDDVAIEHIVDFMDVNLYEMPMVHTGGNYMVDGYGTAASTMLVLQENPLETELLLQEIAFNYLGVDNYMFLPDPLGEYIAHIDCWGKFLAVDKVLIGKVPQTDPRYANYEEVAETFAQALTPWGNHYKVYRVYANPNSNLATPYTNSLIINDHVFVPITGNAHDDEAIAVYQNAMPGYKIVPIMQSNFTPWLSTDALHCRTHELADLGMLYIKHYPILGQKSITEELKITAVIKPLSGKPLVNDSILLFYKINNGDWISNNLTQSTNDTYEFDFSTIQMSPSDQIQYYIYAKDESGRREKHPYIGSADPHRFTIENVGLEYLIEKSVDVYPTTADEVLYVKSNSDIYAVSIYDLKGKLILQENNLMSTIVKIGVNNLSSGFYVVNVEDKKGNSVKKKFVKR